MHSDMSEEKRGGYGHADLPHIDVHERGATVDGTEQLLNERLFMQLLVFDVPAGDNVGRGQRVLKEALCKHKIASVVYADMSNPRAFGLLTWGKDPDIFVAKVRPIFENEGGLGDWVLRPSMTMIGRTYSSGYEQNLKHWILNRPQETVLNEAWPWAVWYPLRRSGAFEQLEGREKGGILREHATIGRAYGAQDLAHDVRLACHGLDTNDNEFVIGLVGKELHPLSHVVQKMRGTRQTAEYIQQMGPFFVGKALWRQAGG